MMGYKFNMIQKQYQLNPLTGQGRMIKVKKVRLDEDQVNYLIEGLKESIEELESDKKTYTHYAAYYGSRLSTTIEALDKKNDALRALQANEQNDCCAGQ